VLRRARFLTSLVCENRIRITRKKHDSGKLRLPFTICAFFDTMEMEQTARMLKVADFLADGTKR
jgi:hypothetical protein